MDETENKSASVILMRIASILKVADEVAEKILTEVLEAESRDSLKSSVILADLIKLIQLLEKQYGLLRMVEKEQDFKRELPQPNEEIIRNYLNNKHAEQSRAQKLLDKNKQKHN